MRRVTEPPDQHPAMFSLYGGPHSVRLDGLRQGCDEINGSDDNGDDKNKDDDCNYEYAFKSIVAVEVAGVTDSNIDQTKAE